MTPRWYLALALALASAGCGGGDVQMSMAPAGGCDSPCGAVDMSCVRYLGFVAVSDGDEEYTSLCAPVPPGAMRTLCDHELGDAIDLALPAGLTAVEVAGFGSELGCGTTTVFGGHATYAPGDGLRVPIQCNLDCSTLSQRVYDVRLVDLGALARDRACTAPAGVRDLDIALGVLQDFRRYAPSPYFNVGFEPFYGVELEAAPSADGRARLSGESFDVGDVFASCLSIDAGNGAYWNTSCVDVGRTGTLCGDDAVVELGWLDPGLAQQIEAALDGVDIGGWYHAGIAWDTAARRPIAGASLRGLPAGTAVLYLDPGEASMTVRSAAETGPSGLFVVAGEMIAGATVAAPGYAPRDVTIAVPSYNASAGVVALEPQ